ncbi:hypothetical protein ON010_g15341 [Phytophthora cinnamomi]|nr:hypothetical protein ON010_g15341 [Phytophthora cinnamomi]
MVNHGASHCDSSKTRGHIRSFRHLVEDTNAFITFAKQSLFPQVKALRHGSNTVSHRSASGMGYTLPLIISGVSFGALLGMHTVLSGCHEYQAAFWGGATVGMEMSTAWKLQATVIQALSLLVPKVRLVAPLDYEMLWRDPGYLEDFKADALATTDDLTARTMQQTMTAMNRLMRDKRIEQPDSEFCRLRMLFLTGSEDHIADQGITRQFFSRLANIDKEFEVFDGVFHCVFEDPERDAVPGLRVALATTASPCGDRPPPAREDTVQAAPTELGDWSAILENMVNCRGQPAPSAPHHGEARAGPRAGVGCGHGAGSSDARRSVIARDVQVGVGILVNGELSTAPHSALPPALRGQVPEPPGAVALLFRAVPTGADAHERRRPLSAWHRRPLPALHPAVRATVRRGLRCAVVRPAQPRGQRHGLAQHPGAHRQLSVPGGRHQCVRHVREEIHLPGRAPLLARAPPPSPPARTTQRLRRGPRTPTRDCRHLARVPRRPPHGAHRTTQIPRSGVGVADYRRDLDAALVGGVEARCPARDAIPQGQDRPCGRTR